MIDVQPLTESDRDWADQLEAESWSKPVVARLGELIDPTQLPGFIAFLDGRRAGLASYAVRCEECELVTIRSLHEGRGVGRALLDAVRAAAIEAGCTRLWLITTNDNLRALEHYQRWGMEIVAFHRHAVTEARRHLKPSIPEHGAHGIPIAHELELELRLQRRVAESEDNELDERPRRPPRNVEHPKELYRGGLEIIADVVRRADDPDDPADREAAWMTIKSVLREVEKHTEPEEPPSPRRKPPAV